MKKWIALSVSLLLFAGQVPIAKADEISELKQQLAEQAKMLKQMQKRLDQLEMQQQMSSTAEEKRSKAVDQEYIDTMVSRAIDKNKSKVGAVPDWVSKITPYGDFRYRYESLRNRNVATGELDNNRRRNRIRARFGFEAEIDDQWDVNFRIATGSSDSPTSTNQTIGDSFSSKEIWLDLAYADYHPDNVDGLNVFLGKMKNPFYRVGGNQLIWDGDVSPEGGAARYKWNLNPSDVATVTGGAFWLNERFSGADAGYFGIQGMLKHKFHNDSHLIAGASYYDIGNIENKTSAASGVTLMGNTATTPGGIIYKYDYNIVEGFAEYGWNYDGMPIALFGNYIENTAAPEGSNTAYSIGAQLNKAEKPGSWQLKTNYREVESDAVFGGLSDSDFIDGGTGGKGWVIGGKYQLTNNMQAGLTYFINDRDRRDTGGSGGSGSQTYDRLMADLEIKF